jgi:hypothetical protein
VVKYRFDAVTIAALLQSEWWTWPDQELLDIMPWPGTMQEFIVYSGLRTGVDRGKDREEQTTEQIFRRAMRSDDGAHFFGDFANEAVVAPGS